MKMRFSALASTALLSVLATTAAGAQTVETTAGWERPFGVAPGQEQRAWNGITGSASAAGRTKAGNRVVINGLIQTGVGVNARVNSGFGTGGVGSNATAIGNQLNVNVSGRWNTVVINSTQINNGNITANAQANGDVSKKNDR